MPLVNRVVFISVFSLKREAHSALSRFESSNPLDHTVSIMTLSLKRRRRSLRTIVPSLKTSSPRRNLQLTLSLLCEVKGGFNW